MRKDARHHMMPMAAAKVAARHEVVFIASAWRRFSPGELLMH